MKLDTIKRTYMGCFGGMSPPPEPTIETNEPAGETDIEYEIRTRTAGIFIPQGAPLRATIPANCCNPPH